MSLLQPSSSSSSPHQQAQQQQHRPAPYSIAVAALIALHCEDPSPLYTDAAIDHDGGGDSNGDKSSKQLVLQVEGVLQDVLLQRLVVDGNDNESNETAAAAPAANNNTNNHWSSRHAPTVQSLFDALPVAIAARLRAWLVTASATVDALIDLVAALQTQTETTAVVVDAGSVHGVYLRSVVLGFEELSFAAVLELWRALRRQVVANPHNPNGIDDTNTNTNNTPNDDDDDDDDNNTSWTRSAHQMEESIRRVAQQHGAQRLSAGAETTTMQSQVSAVLQHHPELPAAHFLQFLLCLETGERVGAVHALHQYLDYALIWQQAQQESEGEGETSDSTNTVLPLAPILNACLHEAFGEGALLAAAVQEAVRVAQQSDHNANNNSNNNNSRACAAYALGWMGAIAAAAAASDSSNVQQQQQPAVPLLQRCVERCRRGEGSSSSGASSSSSLRALQAGALLERAALTHDWRPWQAATAGGPAAVEISSSSSSSDATSATTADSSSNNSNNYYYCDRPMALALAAVTTSHSSSAADPLWTAKAALVAAGLWHHRGEGWLAAHATKVALGGGNAAAANNALSSPNCAGAIRNVSVSLLSGGDCDARRLLRLNNENNNNDEDYCVYGNALRALVQLRDAHQLPVGGGDTFLLEAALLVHEWAVRRGQFDDAEAVLVECFSHVHPHTYNYSSKECGRLEIRSQQALLRSRQGRHREAQDLLTQEISRLQNSGNKTSQQQDQSARLLLQLSLVHLECCRQQSSSSSTNNRCTAVLAPLLECLTLSEQLGMTGLHAEALSVLGQVHWRHGDFRRAVAVLRAALPQLLQPCGTHVGLQAEAYFTLARCHVDLAAAAPKSKSNRHLQQAVREFQRAEQGFAACHDVERLKETYYWQARTYNALSMLPERDAASNNFVRLSSTSDNSWASDSNEQQRNNTDYPMSSSRYPNPLTSLSNREDLLMLAARPGPAAAVSV